MDLRDQLQASLGSAYTLDRELGGGAMSRVFVARDVALGRDVVVKLLSPELSGAVSADRFQREIMLAARLQHPNIVPLLAAGDADGLPFYTMPFVAGESLRDRLARDGPLPIREAATLLRDVARALAHAHANGVVHRDIKPDNVLLAHDYAMVTDFGIAKAVAASARGGVAPTLGDSSSNGLTALGVSLGTPAYMAPEQVVGDPNVDHRADIYAFGAMAYEALTGHPPFAARSAQAMLAAQITEPPPPIETLREGIPPPFAALVMRCLEKNPFDRPPTAEGIAATLGELYASPAPGVRVSSQLGRLGSASLALIAVAVVVASIWLAARPWQNAGIAVENRHLIAVVPFRVTAGDSNVRSLREGMLDLITAKLTGSTRTVDTRTLLVAWRRAGGTATTDLDERRALGVAKELHAGRVLQGEIVQTNDTLSITGTLIDASSPRQPATAAVRGNASAIAALVDSLVAKLLVAGADRAERAPDALAKTPLPALQAYLEGQDAYRAGQYARAADAFARALAIDSTFALAGMRLGLAAQWTFDRRAAAGREIAFRYRDRLSEVDRLILGKPSNPARRGSCADDYATSDQAVQAAPDVPELWYHLADVLFHCGDAMGIAEAWPRALAGFERALRYDPAFAPAHEHLPMLYAALGDTTAARRALAQQDSSILALPSRYSLAPDENARLTVMRETMLLPPARASGLAEASVTSGEAYIDDADSLLASAATRAVTAGERRTVASATRAVALMRGQPRRAAEAVREMNAPIGTYVLDALFADGDSAAAAAVIPALQRTLESQPSDAEQDDWMTDVFALAQHGVEAADVAAARRSAEALRRLVLLSDTARRGQRARHLASLVDAQIAVIEKRTDARRLVVGVDSMLKRVEGGAYVGRVGNLIVARLWERLGDTRRAYDATRRVQYNSGLAPYLITYARERARLAVSLGEREDAIKQYRMYVGVRARPDAALRGDSDRAKRELARLEKTPSGRS